jgi:hypothetical protein
MRKVEDLQAVIDRVGDLDPDQYKAAMAAKQELEDLKRKGVLDKVGVSDEEFQKVLSDRTEQMRNDFETQNKALSDQNAKLVAEAERLASELKHDRVRTVISEAVSEFGVPRKGAMHDILSRASSVWDLDEKGNPVAMQEGRKMYGSDGEKLLTPAEWVKTLAREANYLFEPNAGGGAGGGSGNGAAKVGTIDWDDQDAISRNWEAIKDGEVEVVRSGE